MTTEMLCLWVEVSLEGKSVIFLLCLSSVDQQPRNSMLNGNKTSYMKAQMESWKNRSLRTTILTVLYFWQKK